MRGGVRERRPRVVSWRGRGSRGLVPSEEVGEGGDEGGEEGGELGQETARR